MANRIRSYLIAGSLLPALSLMGCVSQSSYDALQAQNQQLQQQVAAQSSEIAAGKAQISRLQGAIKYTIDSDLLFPSGGWQLSDQGKKIISQFAAKLAPTTQNKIVVNGYTDNKPIGPDLIRKGVTTNQQLSEKRATNVMEYMISQGLSADLVSAKGWGEENPVAANDTAKGREQNRRVELTLAGTGG